MKLKDLPVGALVKDTTWKYLGDYVIFRVLEHGHTGDPTNSTTLECRDIITCKCFDAKEANNSDSNRQSYGNNRYLYSNILQWLNSDGAASSWYTAQHTADAPPSSANVMPVSGTGCNPYDTEAGFLSFTSNNFKSALLTVLKTTVKPTVDGGGSESVSSNMFLLSTTEVGLANENSIAEGSIYSYYNTHNTANDRKKNLANDATKGNYSSATSPWHWWLRTPNYSESAKARNVAIAGSIGSTQAYHSGLGVSPAFCISQDTTVSNTVDSDGAYTIKWNPEVKKIYIGDSNGVAKKIYPTGKTMTARFNLSDSNPATWGEYLDGAVNMTAGSSAWDDFFGHYPAMIKNGQIVGELDPSQGYAKYTDGTTADITSGADGDVMIVFPRRGLKIWQDNGYLYVSMTTEVGKTGYEYYAHTYKGNDCDWFALGRYNGYYDGSKLRSLSGKTPTVSQTIGTFRTYAQAGGTGYEQSAFYQLTYRQAMYMLKYLGANAQIAVGRGYVDGNSSKVDTGGTNALGMDYGETTGKVQCSLFGLEDFWGNIWEFVDGIYSDANRKLLAADGNYNDTGTNYTAITNKTNSNNYAGYLKTCLGTSEGGFSLDVTTVSDYGSESTYYCDYAYINAEKIARFGDDYNDADYAGVFSNRINAVVSYTDPTCGARLMFMHTS